MRYRIATVIVGCAVGWMFQGSFASAEEVISAYKDPSIIQDAMSLGQLETSQTSLTSQLTSMQAQTYAMSYYPTASTTYSPVTSTSTGSSSYSTTSSTGTTYPVVADVPQGEQTLSDMIDKIVDAYPWWDGWRFYMGGVVKQRPPEELVIDVVDAVNDYFNVNQPPPPAG